MRKLIAFGLALCGGASGVLGACGGDDNSAASGDGGPSDQSVTPIEVSVPDVTGGPGFEAGGDCTVGTSVGDPVLLCSQETALLYIFRNAYTQGHGVAPGFSSQMPYGPVAQAHQWTDDLGFIASIGAYHCSANYYGDTTYAATFDGALPDLAKTLTSELSAANSTYDGAVYFRLRNAAQALYQVMDTSDAAAMNAAADAFARNLQANFVHTIPLTAPPPVIDSGAPDGSDAADSGSSPSDATTNDDALADAAPTEAGAGADGGTTTDAQADAGPATAQVIGTLNANGTVSYAPPSAVMAAAALLDMASRNAGRVDAGADVEAWQAAATSALAYMVSRARDPATGLYYASLTTSSDPGHDALDPGAGAGADAGAYPADALLTDVQGPIALALARAQSSAVGLAGDGGADGSSGGTPPYGAQIESLVTAMTAAQLFNGQTTPPAGVDPSTTQAPPGAWMAGLVPSLGLTITNQTAISNALVLGGYGRAQALGAASRWGWELSGVRQAFNFSGPTGVWPAHSNFASVVVDPAGQVAQLAYLGATSKDWNWARAFSPTGADAGLDPNAMNYSTAAINAMVEGFTQFWYGQVSMTPCAY